MLDYFGDFQEVVHRIKNYAYEGCTVFPYDRGDDHVWIHCMETKQSVKIFDSSELETEEKRTLIKGMVSAFTSGLRIGMKCSAKE